LIGAFGYDMLRNSLPALRVVLGMISPEDGIESCEELNEEVRTDLVPAVKGNSVAVKR
jgi:dihydroorotase